MSSENSVPSESPRPAKKPRTRASRACLVCRKRKVRCNVDSIGVPCSNCSLDHEACIITQKRERRPRRYVDTFTLSKLAVGSAPSWRRMNQPGVARDVSGAASSNWTLPVEALGSATGSFDQSDLDTETSDPCEERSPLLNSPHSVQEQSLAQDATLGNIFRQNNPEDSKAEAYQESNFTATVPFSAYRFLVTSNLHKLPAEDINFLDLKKCLRVPAQPYLDEFCQQYFRYVHPFLPLINEAAFWGAYHAVDEVDVPGSNRQFPLLLFQAMLFASCSFVRLGTLQKLDFASAQEARRTMYERAKMLYNFGAEKSKLHIAQSALLLSQWTPSVEEAAANRPNMAWLSIAIENARSIRAHRCDAAAAEKRQHNVASSDTALRRLWACCIVRDGTAAISLRRCCHIAVSDTMSDRKSPLNFDDLAVEVHESRVYDPQAKTELIKIFLELASMCAHLINISVVLFPPEGGIPDQTKPNSQMENIIKILACKMTLDEWQTKTETRSAPSNISTGSSKTRGLHSSVTLFINLRHIYYHSARIALANRQMLVYFDTDMVEKYDMDVLGCHQEVQDSISAIDNCLWILMEFQLVRFLPITIIPCIALPYALQTVSNETQKPLRRSPGQVFNQVMKTCDPLYEATEGLRKTVNLLRDERQLRLLDQDVSIKTLNSSRGIETTVFHAVCYMRLALSMDMSLGTGHLPDEKDMPISLRETPADKANKLDLSAEIPTGCRSLGSPGQQLRDPKACDELRSTKQNTEAALQTELEQLHSNMKTFEGEIAIDDFMALDSAFAGEFEVGQETRSWWHPDSYPEWLPQDVTCQPGDLLKESEEQYEEVMVVDTAYLDEACAV